MVRVAIQESIPMIQIIKKILIRFLEKIRNKPTMTLLEEIKKEEGFESEPYICSNGYLTVGYGKRVDYLKVDEKTAEKWLIIDLEELDGKLDRSFTWYIDSPRDVKDVVKAKKLGQKLGNAESRLRKIMYDIEQRFQADTVNFKLQKPLKSFTLLFPAVLLLLFVHVVYEVLSERCCNLYLIVLVVDGLS